MKKSGFAIRLLIMVFCLCFAVTLSSCMDEEDYYKNAEVDEIVEKLEELVSALDESNSEAISKINEAILKLKEAEDLNEEKVSELEDKLEALIEEVADLNAESDSLDIVNEKLDALIEELRNEAAKELSVKLTSTKLNIYEDKIVGKLLNSEESISLADKVNIPSGASVVVAKDIYLEKTVPSNEIPLNVGENTYYVLVTNGENQRLYKATLYRRAIYTVSYYSDANTLYSTESVGEGLIANPPAIQAPTGYDFDKWSYDFTKPITSDVTAVASYKRNSSFVYVGSVTLNKTELELKVNESESLIATILPDNATEKILTWTTSNPSVATVSDGVVTAVGVGTATITATSENGKSASCEVLGSCGGDGDCGHLTDPEEYNNGKGVCKECGTKIKHTHEDENKDSKCDFCGRKMDGGEEEVIQYPWLDEDPVELLIMMTHADYKKQNPSVCERYLAGETKDEDSVDRLVDQRNINAEILANVHATYKYYPKDDGDYDYLMVSEIIPAIDKSNKTEGAPDIFVNFTYDLIACSLKGCFENLKNTDNMTNGATEDGNYFEFIDEDYNEEEDNRGYMLDYMNSTSLSQDKTYILASDYFIDLIRSFYIVPVNIALLESVGMQVTGDLNNDDKFTIDDFYIEVMDEKKWTYNKLAEYSNSINQEFNDGVGDSLDDVLGFAISHGEVSANGLIYSADYNIIDKYWNDNAGVYEYQYYSTCDPLDNIYTAVCELVNKPGVLVVTDKTEGADIGGDKYQPWLAVRVKFCANQILFGDVMLLGALESSEYQDLLNNSSGFGVVPVPNYHEFQEGERYVTAIHNSARTGAIKDGTENYTACTAYLNYLSTHSSDVLETYYNINLQYQFTMGDEGTTRMLQYIRSNVRSSFDSLVDDMVCINGGAGFYTLKWNYPMLVNNYQYTYIRKFYTENIGDKYTEIRELAGY